MPHQAKFLHEQEPASSRHPGYGRRRIFFVCIAAALVLALWLSVLVFVGVQTVAALSDGKAALEAAEREARELQFDRAGVELTRAAAYFRRADRGAVILQSAQWVPWIGQAPRAVRTVTDTLSRLTEHSLPLV